MRYHVQICIAWISVVSRRRWQQQPNDVSDGTQMMRTVPTGRRGRIWARCTQRWPAACPSWWRIRWRATSIAGTRGPWAADHGQYDEYVGTGDSQIRTKWICGVADCILKIMLLIKMVDIYITYIGNIIIIITLFWFYPKFELMNSLQRIYSVKCVYIIHPNEQIEKQVDIPTRRKL